MHKLLRTQYKGISKNRASNRGGRMSRGSQFAIDLVVGRSPCRKGQLRAGAPVYSRTLGWVNSVLGPLLVVPRTHVASRSIKHADGSG
jgi:hypothetical protein